MFHQDRATQTNCPRAGHESRPHCLSLKAKLFHAHATSKAHSLLCGVGTYDANLDEMSVAKKSIRLHTNLLGSTPSGMSSEAHTGSRLEESPVTRGWYGPPVVGSGHAVAQLGLASGCR